MKWVKWSFPTAFTVWCWCRKMPHLIVEMYLQSIIICGIATIVPSFYSHNAAGTSTVKQKGEQDNSERVCTIDVPLTYLTVPTWRWKQTRRIFMFVVNARKSKTSGISSRIFVAILSQWLLRRFNVLCRIITTSVFTCDPDNGNEWFVDKSIGKWAFCLFVS